MSSTLVAVWSEYFLAKDLSRTSNYNLHVGGCAVVRLALAWCTEGEAARDRRSPARPPQEGLVVRAMSSVASPGTGPRPTPRRRRRDRGGTAS